MAVFWSVLTGLLVLALVLGAYGTIAKNNWGINLHPVSCPICKTPLPRLYESRSLHQAMWGGWTCPVCGAGVDKWGREVPPNAPPTVVRPEDEMRGVIRRKLALIAPVTFCLCLLLDWTGLIDGGFPRNWAQALIQICVNIGWSAFSIVVSYFVITGAAKRSTSEQNGRGAGRGNKSVPNRGE
jgi:hypothetical protein